MTKNRKKLHLNKEDKKFLGVCAGLADYLEVEAWIIRLVLVVSLFFGAWFLVPLYFIAYFILDSKKGSLKSSVSDSNTFKHLKNVDYRKHLYKNSQERKVLGVCAGLADYLEVDVTIIRIITVVMFVVAGPIPWFAYFAAYFLLDEKPQAQPVRKGASKEQVDIKDRIQSKRREFKYCIRKFSSLQERLSRMEAYVTSNQFKLHQEFKNIS